MRRTIQACLSLLLIVIGFNGCALNPADLQGISHETEIFSEPLGARIEINNEYVGVTPLHLVIPRRYTTEFMGLLYGGTRVTGVEPLRIIAYPVTSGQYMQTKFIGNEPTPWRIFFDMRLEPSPQRQEIKQDIKLETR